MNYSLAHLFIYVKVEEEQRNLEERRAREDSLAFASGAVHLPTAPEEDEIELEAITIKPVPEDSQRDASSSSSPPTPPSLPKKVL